MDFRVEENIPLDICMSPDLFQALQDRLSKLCRHSEMSRRTLSSSELSISLSPKPASHLVVVRAGHIVVVRAGHLVVAKASHLILIRHPVPLV